MLPPAPLVCVVSDRTRLASAAGREVDGLIERLSLAAQAGADLVQIREPDLPSRVLYDVVRRTIEAAGSTASRILVSDRVDVALAAGAHGVHLKAESMETAAVRALVPEGFLVGRSVHAAPEAVTAAEGGADYLIFGTVLPTRSKPSKQPTAGLAALQAAVAAVRVPVLGIGGMTVDAAPDVARTGAAGIAAIGLFAEPAGRAAQVLEVLKATVAAVRQGFADVRSTDHERLR